MEKNITTANTTGSAVTTYKLTTEQLAKYNTPSITSHSAPTDHEGKPIIDRQKALPATPKRQYAPKAYTVDDKDLLALGNRTGYNAMKSKYQISGIEDLNPNKNIAELEDFQGISILTISEYVINSSIEGDISDDDLYEIRKACYNATNHEMYRIKRDIKKHLYIETMIPDTDGETMVTQIEDVTANIEKECLEIWETIKPYTTIQDRKILKYIAKGYTYETIAKRLGCSKSTAFTKVRKARTHAQRALRETEFTR